jgi:hypothetical protein
MVDANLRAGPTRFEKEQAIHIGEFRGQRYPPEEITGDLASLF